MARCCSVWSSTIDLGISIMEREKDGDFRVSPMEREREREIEVIWGLNCLNQFGVFLVKVLEGTNWVLIWYGNFVKLALL